LRGSTKSQAPNNKQIPSTKHQIPNVWSLRLGGCDLFRIWSLGVVICLEVGICDLRFGVYG
jgi:hypothetical protein